MPVRNPKIHKKLVVLQLKKRGDWITWLKSNHTQHDGIWIQFAKKNSGRDSITYEEAREGAIIYGWIDGLINKWDDQSYLRKFTPRRPRSSWSQINRGIAETLIKQKKMKPAGLAEVNAAKKDGRWAAAYASPSNITIPPALQSALNKNPAAKKFFASISKSNRYAFLYRIHNAKRDETKARHIAKTIEMLNHGEVYHPDR